MSIENQIIKYLNEQNELSAHEFQEHLQVSRQLLHRVLKRMIEDNLLEKMGTPPKVFYRLNKIVGLKPFHAFASE